MNNTNVNVNKSEVNEDDLEDVLEIIKGLDGDQIMENMERQTPNPRKGEKSKKETKRKITTLGSVAREFVKWAYAEPTGILDLNVASETKMRRIYEVVNVLEGLSLMKKTGVTKVRTCREYEPGRHIEL